MKKVSLALAFIFLPSIFLQESIANNGEWRQNSLKAVRSEKQVIEAIFPNDSTTSFWVSMRDNKTRRDGFAEYLCLVLSEHGMPKGEFIVITIWDAAAMARGNMREIGKNECNLK